MFGNGTRRRHSPIDMEQQGCLGALIKIILGACLIAITLLVFYFLVVTYIGQSLKEEQAREQSHQPTDVRSPIPAATASEHKREAHRHHGVRNGDSDDSSDSEDSDCEARGIRTDGQGDCSDAAADLRYKSRWTATVPDAEKRLSTYGVED